MVATYGGSVVHGVEGGDFVDTHRGHLQYPGHLVHDADTGEAVLALAEVEQRHHGSLLVLRGIPREHLLDELLILGRELEGDRGVVVGSIAVHHEGVAANGRRDGEGAPLASLELSQGSWASSPEERS